MSDKKKVPGYNFLHSHPRVEGELGVDNDHVIVDKKDWEKTLVELRKKDFSTQIKELNEIFTSVISGKKYLITTENWFLGPDGKQYRAAWGKVEILSDKILGIKTNAKSTNWYAKVGREDYHILIAGCQIHYAIRTDEKPNDGLVDETLTDVQHGLRNFRVPSSILILE